MGPHFAERLSCI